MPAPTTDQVRKMVTLRKQGLSMRAIGRELGFATATITKYIRDFAGEGGGGIVTEAGTAPPKNHSHNKLVDSTDIDGTIELVRLDRPASPEELAALAGLDPKKWVPTHSRVNTWQGYGKLKSTVGDVTTETMDKIQLYQSKASFKRLITENVEEAVADFMRSNVKPLPKPSKAELKKRKLSAEAQMLCWGFWDAHLGMYAWNKEVGEDFDLDIAMKRIFNSIDDMIEELKGYEIEKLIMPCGNDFLHYDSVKKTTTFGDHYLDCDSRYGKVFQGALMALAYMVERALELTDDVEILYVPGNHDYTSAFGLCVALDQRFRNDPRVSSDLSMNPRKYRTYGGTLLGFDHGKDVKATSYPVVVATEAKEMWANSTWREMQIGHTHQRRETMYHGMTPVNGILVRTNPSLSNVDAWHHSKGFLGEPLKSVEAWRYDRTGYRGSHVVFARDVRDEEGQEGRT